MVQEQRYRVEGMHCAGCVGKVEAALEAVAGVESASVSLAEHTATVRGAARPAAVLEAVAGVGYRAEPVLTLDDEKRALAFDAAEDARLRGLVAVSLAAAVGFHVPGWFEGGPGRALAALTSLAILAVPGREFFTGAWKALRGGHATMDTLIALGTGAAWVYSVGGFGHPFWEVIPVVIGLVLLGRVIERRQRGRTTAAIRALLDLAPPSARVLRDGAEVEVPVAEVRAGERLRVKPGDSVPVDGEIVEGSSEVDESMLSGEPMPVAKGPGARVAAGTRNGSGSFVFTATAVGDATALAGIIRLVRRAQAAKPRLGRLADKVAGVFVPAVVLIALGAAAYWGAPGPALAVLVVACPCALGLATPIAITVGVGQAARRGLLVRGGDALQAAGEATVAVLDKTGTVTEGRPDVVDVLCAPGEDEAGVLAAAAALEVHSEHPLAAAVVRAARARGAAVQEASGFESASGRGARGSVGGETVLVGNAAFLAGAGVAAADWESRAEELARAAKTPVYVARGARVIGLLGLGDALKQDSKDAVARLKALGLRVILLTGDRRAAAEAVGAAIGADEVIAEVLPGDKAAVVAELQEGGAKVAMVGDGVNDAPALARADCGIALGAGTDVAIEAADLTLMRASLHGVADAVELSRAVVRNIKQNLGGAFVYNVLGIPLAAAGMLDPAFAGAAMALSSVTVVFNANRLRLFETVTGGER